MVDPWSSAGVKDYGALMEEFGVSEFDFEGDHRFLRRDIVFGQRDYGPVAEAMERGGDFAVMSGFVPSGEPHLGHRMVMEEIVYHQERGGSAFPAIADMEGRAVRGIPLDEGRERGREYLLSLAALGLEPEDCYAYYQSENPEVRDLAHEISDYTRWSDVEAIYGFGSDTSIGHAFMPPLQAADILHPQLEKHGGPKPTVVPVGIDQDPHLRLARDLAYRIRLLRVEEIEDHLKVRSKRLGREELEGLAPDISADEVEVFEEHLDVYGASREDMEAAVREFELSKDGYGFYPPAATYHKFMTGLTGGKMSSSEEGSYVSLLEEPEEGRSKVMSAQTGGRTTAEEQREEGGEPDECAVFELHTFHATRDDEELEDIYRRCRSGDLLCGECKSMAADEVEEFLREHQSRRDDLEGELDDYMEVFE